MEFRMRGRKAVSNGSRFIYNIQVISVIARNARVCAVYKVSGKREYVFTTLLFTCMYMLHMM